MRSQTPLKLVQSRSPVSLFIVLALGFCAVYCVPFLVPVHDGISDSYLFGFSNRTALLLMSVFTFGFAVWTRGLELKLPDRNGRSGPSLYRTGVVITALVVTCASVIWLVAKVLIPSGESQYFIDRYAMYRAGWHIYRGFEFDYGPLMFYPALWVSRLLHISTGNAYFLCWILQWVLGTWLLLFAISVAAKGTAYGRTIFLLLIAIFLPALTSEGSNYTPLRFSGSLASAAWVFVLYNRGASNLMTFGFACCSATAILFYSPEQGIAFTIGTVLFFVVCVRSRRAIQGIVCFGVVMVVVFSLAVRLRVLDNVLTVGGGTLNFPLLISFQSLFLLLLLLIAGCVFVASFRLHRSNDLLAYLICLSLISTPAAFSRADVGHIVINTLGALIAALVVLSQYPAPWRVACTSFVLLDILVGYGQISGFVKSTRTQLHGAVFRTRYYSAGLDKAYTGLYRATHRNSESHLNELRAAALRDLRPDLLRLSKQSPLWAPFGFPRRISEANDDPEVITGRYPFLFAISSTKEINDKVAELRSHPDWPIVVPFPEKTSCVEDPNEIRKGLKGILIVPYVPKPVHRVYAGAPLCDYINANYHAGNFAPPAPGYFIWFPNNRRSEDMNMPNY